MKHPVVNLEESFIDNVIRLLSWYNISAINHLQARSGTNEHIHQARLCFKRIRSLLRLARPGLGENNYKTLNVFYRDNARQLSHARDLTAVIEAIAPMIQNRRSTSTRSFLIKLQRQWILERRQKTGSGEINQLKAGVAAQLSSIREYLDAGQIPLVPERDDSRDQQYPIPRKEEQHDKNELSATKFPDDNRHFVEGLVRTFRQGKRLYRSCKKDPEDHQLHEWRKRVKNTWYQLVMLQPLWPGMIRAWCKEWQTLSVYLGEYNDLVMIQAALDSIQLHQGRRKEVRNIRQSVRLFKQNLLHKSLIQGRKLYSEKATELSNRLLSCFPYR